MSDWTPVRSHQPKRMTFKAWWRLVSEHGEWKLNENDQPIAPVSVIEAAKKARTIGGRLRAKWKTLRAR